jgi:hypothetical protein
MALLRPIGGDFSMKRTVSSIAAAAFLIPAATLMGQMTGTSHPEALNDPIVASQADTPHYVKPSPAIPMASAAQAQTPALHTHDEVLPATAPTQGTQTYAATSPATAPLATRNESFVITDDVNSGVVTEVAWPENQVPEGTLFRARLSTEIATDSTPVGTPFRATLTHPVEHYGRVIFPEGTIVSGRVTDLHGGHRIGGAAYIHLEPELLTLPDGSVRHIGAQVADLKSPHGAHVDSEGTIVGNEHAKGTAAALGLTTASAAAAGAMIGGGVGAVVGAGIGAGVGTIWWLKRESHQTLEPGTDIVFSLSRPILLETNLR